MLRGLSNRLRGRSLTLVLWTFAALLASIVTAALFYQRSSRDDVSAYIEDVNEAQSSFAVRYGAVNRVFEEFKLSPDAATEQLPTLRTSARTLTALRVRIERVDAPEDAEMLRTRLIAFFRQQEAVANELVAIAVYLPKLSAAEQPLADVNRRLREGLSESSSLDAQANAVRAYGVRLARVANALEAIRPPRLLDASHQAYVTQLHSYAEASQALQRAVRQNDQAGVDAAVERLRAAAVAPPGTLRAQSAAIVAFNSRVSRIQTLGLAVERERQRLDEEV